MRGARTLAIALAACAAVPAIAGGAVRERSVYSAVKASGSEKVTFTADPGTCTRFSTCGQQGNVAYKFGGGPHGKLALEVDSRGRIAGTGSFSTTGTTVSHVTAPTACTATVRHRRESFTLTGRLKLGKLLFGLHGDKTDYFATKCAGPTEADAAVDHALPAGTFKRTDFDHASSTFGLTGSAFFREKGYRGTVAWKLSYRVVRRACSPHCRAVSKAG
jgi:hypothetical protein